MYRLNLYKKKGSTVGETDIAKDQETELLSYV